MDNLTFKDIQRMAKLAQLDVSKEEAKRLHPSFLEILSFMKQLKEVDLLPDISETSSPSHNFPQEECEITANPSLSPQEALKNAPDRKNNHFRVPKVIK